MSLVAGVTRAALLSAAACAAAIAANLEDDPLQPLVFPGLHSTTIVLLVLTWPGLYLLVAALVRPTVGNRWRGLGVVLASGAAWVGVLGALAMLLAVSDSGLKPLVAVPLAWAALQGWLFAAAFRLGKELGLSRRLLHWVGALAVGGMLAVIWLGLIGMASARRDLRPAVRAARSRLASFAEAQARHAASHGGAHAEPAALDAEFAEPSFHGYGYTFHRGPSGAWAYVAVPHNQNGSGVGAFCIDATGVLRGRPDGIMAAPVNGACPPDATPAPDLP